MILRSGRGSPALSTMWEVLAMPWTSCSCAPGLALNLVMRQANPTAHLVGSEVSRPTDSQSQPPLESPEGRQKLPLAGRFESERLVGMLRVVIVLQHPQHQLGDPRRAIDLDQPVQHGAQYPASAMSRRNPGGFNMSAGRSSWLADGLR